MVEPLEKHLVELGAELLPEPSWIREERKAVQAAGEAVVVHRFDSGSNR